jgi:UDP-2,3-diacylglucosamine hydrolase
MLAAMISDAHLQGLDDPNQHLLVELLDRLDCPRVYLLGDLFHFWWGFPDVVYGDFVPVLAALHRLRRRGTELSYVPGNHDFELGPFFQRLDVHVASRLEPVLGGRRFVLLHGDEADESVGYKLTRSTLRGGAFSRLMHRLGPRRAQRLGHKLAGGSRDYGASEPSDKLVSAQLRLAERELRQADVVVMGHSHAPGVHHLEGGTYVNLGDFVQHHTWLAVTESGLELRQG